MSATGLLEPNPLFVRETRVRWRGRAFIVMLAYVGLMAGAIFCNYLSNYRTWDPGNPFISMARLGHDLFLNISWIQTLGWWLLAPSLTATSIAGEREQGLLESLQITHLSAWSIVRGKLFAVLIFISLVLLATLPITSICFLMGGVSPHEFTVAAAIQFMTALTGAIVGLFCSAWSRRSNTAMNWTWAFILVWAIGSCLALASLKTTFSIIFCQTNPVFAILALISPSAGPPFSGLSLLGIDAAPWAICLVCEGLLSVLLLWLTQRGVSRPLADPVWMEQKGHPRHSPKRGTPDTAASEQNRDTTPEPHSPAQKPRASHWELPITRLLRSSNPVLQRELRAKFRLRKLPKWQLLLAICVGLYLLYWYVWLWMQFMTYPSSTRYIWPIICSLWVAAIMLLTAMMGACGFTGERQTGTWEALALSRLRAGQIITAKMIAPLFACAIYSLPVWPLLAACMKQGTWKGSAIISLLIIAASGWFCLAWGLWISWRARRTATAAGWTIGTLIGLMVLLPGFTLGLTSHARGIEHYFNYWNPFICLNSYHYDRSHNAVLPTGVMCAQILFGAGCLLLLHLRWSMRYNGRER